MAHDKRPDDSNEAGDSRRAFLTGAAVAGVAGVLAGATPAAAQDSGCAPIDRDKLHEIIGKYLLDPVFRDAFDHDARHAVQQVGISLTPNEEAAVGRLQNDLIDFARSPEVEQVSNDLIAYVDRSIQG